MHCMFVEDLEFDWSLFNLEVDKKEAFDLALCLHHWQLALVKLVLLQCKKWNMIGRIISSLFNFQNFGPRILITHILRYSMHLSREKNENATYTWLKNSLHISHCME